jgi:hypothetical protein
MDGNPKRHPFLTRRGPNHLRSLPYTTPPSALPSLCDAFYGEIPQSTHLRLALLVGRSLRQIRQILSKSTLPSSALRGKWMAIRSIGASRPILHIGGLPSLRGEVVGRSPICAPFYTSIATMNSALLHISPKGERLVAKSRRLCPLPHANNSLYISPKGEHDQGHHTSVILLVFVSSIFRF